MIYLALSVILTSYLTLFFKIIERYKIPPFQAILFNYLTCITEGSIIGHTYPYKNAIQEHWLIWALVLGCLFISMFNLVGYITQNAGVSVASVANKLSLVIPFAFSIYLYHEHLGLARIAGIVVALLAVVFTCLPSRNKENESSKKGSALIYFGLPAILFLGSGCLDTVVKFVQQSYLGPANENTFLVSSFATAGIIGFTLLFLLLIMGKQKFNSKSIVAGIALGIPNYFSIWFLVKVLKQYEGSSSAIIPVNNMGIVLVSSIAGWLLFKEKMSAINWTGILLSVAAIALIAFG